MKKNAPILVTGAAGLAGSAVVEYLRSQLYTCVIPVTRQDADLTNPFAVREMFERIQPDYVFHAAATVYGLGGNMKYQAKSIFENTLINTNVVHCAHLVGVKKFVAMGTNAIYPAPPVIPYREDNIYDGRPHHGEHGYGSAKRHMLAMLEAYEDSYGMPYTYLVSGNLYGPRDRFDTVNGHVIPSMVAKFAKAKQSGDTVKLWGSGRACRDFFFSRDLARLVEMMLANQVFGPINIGSGEIHSIAEAAHILSNVTGVSDDRIIFDRTKPDGRIDCTSDLSRLTALGFRREHSLVRGLSETWRWYVEQPGDSIR